MKNKTEKPPNLFLPYIQGVSEKIQVTCCKLNTRTIVKSRDTLGQVLTEVKTRLPEEKKRELCTGYHAEIVKLAILEKQGELYRRE